MVRHSGLAREALGVCSSLFREDKRIQQGQSREEGSQDWVPPQLLTFPHTVGYGQDDLSQSQVHLRSGKASGHLWFTLPCLLQEAEAMCSTLGLPAF